MNHFFKIFLCVIAALGVCAFTAPKAEALATFTAPFSDSFDSYDFGSLYAQGMWQNNVHAWQVTDQGCYGGAGKCITPTGYQGENSKTGLDIDSGDWSFYVYLPKNHPDAWLFEMDFGPVEGVTQNDNILTNMAFEAKNGGLSINDGFNDIVNDIAPGVWHRIDFKWDLTDPNSCSYAVSVDSGPDVPFSVFSPDPTNCYFHPNHPAIGGVKLFSFSGSSDFLIDNFEGGPNFNGCTVNCSGETPALTDSFDTFNDHGWLTKTPQDPLDQSLMPFDFDSNAGDCHSGGCIKARMWDGLGQITAGSDMFYETGVGSSTGSFTLWAKSISSYVSQGSVSICQSAWSDCIGSYGRTFPDILPKDDTWHQHYFAWRQGTSTVEVCHLLDDTNPDHCQWNSTQFPLGTKFDGVELKGVTPFQDLDGYIWFDDLQDTGVPVTNQCTQNCYSNVMFLPGIEGSRLYAAGFLGTENQIWEPDSLLGNDVPELDLTNTSAANEVYTKEGGIIEQAYPNFSGPNIYKSFAEQMNQLRSNHMFNDWEPIAYDWRLDYQELLTNGVETEDGKIYYHGVNAATSSPYIIQELKRLAATSKTKKVTIIAHSNGGLLAKALLAQPGISEYVDKVILVATPQLGTPESVVVLLHGTNQALPKETLPIYLTDKQARLLSQNTPMAYNLLPSAAYFQDGQESIITFDSSLASVTDWQQKYSDPLNPALGIHTSSGLKYFMTDSSRLPQPQSANDLNTPSITNATLFSNAVATHAQLDAWTPPQNIEVTTIAGWGEPTLKSIIYSRKVYCSQAGQESTPCTKEAEGTRITYSPTLNIDGDGTVQSKSATWSNDATSTQFWINLQNLNETTAIRFDHANILEIPAVETLLTSLITNAPTVFLPTDISKTKPVYDNSSPVTYFILHSPLTLGFLDSSGNYTGSTATSSVFAIPNVDYERFGEVQWLSVPKNLAGKVVMRGTGSGSFSLDIEDVNGDAVLATTTFAGVPSATSTVATIAINPNQSPTASSTLEVDFDGDGVIDTKLHAQQDNMVLPDFTPPEVLLTADSSSRSLHVEGIDTSSTTVQRAATATTITDEAGNTTTLNLKTYSSNSFSYANLSSIQYNHDAPVALNTTISYAWDRSGTLVSQAAVIDRELMIEAFYNKRNDTTTLLMLKPHEMPNVQTIAGAGILKLRTEKGTIRYEFKYI